MYTFQNTLAQDKRQQSMVSTVTYQDTSPMFVRTESDGQHTSVETASAKTQTSRMKVGQPKSLPQDNEQEEEEDNEEEEGE